MITGSSLKQVAAQSIDQGGPGAGGLIFEVFAVTGNTTIYGAGQATYAAGNAKKIQKFLGGIAMPSAVDADHTLLAISTNETTDDQVTITSAAGLGQYVILWGVGGEAQ